MPRAYILGIALAAAAPLVLDPSGDVLNNLVLAAMYASMALGLNIIVGFAGLLDLGYVAFFAIGAYSAGYFASDHWANVRSGEGLSVLVAEPVASLPGIHVNWALVLVIAALAAAIAGALIGVPTLRLRGDYIAAVTLAFGEIIGTVVDNGEQVRIFGGTLTAGRKGITQVDNIDLPLVKSFGELDLRPWYWFALAFIVMVLAVNFRLRNSRVGRAWLAVREDEAVAATLGVPVARTKLMAYALGAAIGGASGAFLASYVSTVNAAQFAFSFSIFILAMVVIGGLGSIGGVVSAAVALSAFNNFILPHVLGGLPGRLGLDFDLAEVSFAIYGLFLVLMMLLRPQALSATTRRPRQHLR
jgi:branched-chain amino acid transport system permease protein